MEHLWPNDKELVYYLHTGKLPEPDFFGNVPEIPTIYKDLKDKGQRKVCGCMISKNTRISECIIPAATYAYIVMPTQAKNLY